MGYPREARQETPKTVVSLADAERQALMADTPDRSFPDETDGFINERFSYFESVEINQTLSPPDDCNLDFMLLWRSYCSAKTEYVAAIEYDCLARLAEARRKQNFEKIEELLVIMVECAVAAVLPSLGKEQSELVTRAFSSILTAIDSTRNLVNLSTNDEEKQISQLTKDDLIKTKLNYDSVRQRATQNDLFNLIMGNKIKYRKSNGSFRNWNWVGSLQIQDKCTGPVASLANSKHISDEALKNSSTTFDGENRSEARARKKPCRK